MSTNQHPLPKEITAAWIAYALHGLALLLFWPFVLGLIINFSKRNSQHAALAASHHRWMIRSVAWAALGTFASVGVIAASFRPVLATVFRAAVNAQPGERATDIAFSIDPGLIFAGMGGATVGMLGLLVVWIWFFYRLIRGALLLNDRRATPS